ncbi:hypothetical protein DPMN_028880 [Dreissena polymorpha]|uniref:Uncharacterized protein n=1 Tax=Dreissena polymorpha TaxID=45954 RepID=A0A9D4LXI8_DREPO|nr:hypothetical protein DPMN_028880 [Dreissena polymorpha]
MPDIRIISDEKQSEQNNNNENLNPSCKDVIFRTPQKRSCEMMNVSHCLSSDFHKAYSDSYLCEKSDWMLGERSSSRSPPSPSVGSRSPQIRSRSPIVNKSPSVRHASSEFNFSPESTEHYRCEVEAESQRVKKRLFEEVANGELLISTIIIQNAQYDHLNNQHQTYSVISMTNIIGITISTNTTVITTKAAAKINHHPENKLILIVAIITIINSHHQLLSS